VQNKRKTKENSFFLWFFQGAAVATPQFECEATL
jgi:hypothetical protein